MTSFPYISDYKLNTTVSGLLCNAPNFTMWVEDCNATMPNHEWILINLFDNAESNYIMGNLTDKDNPEKTANIDGLIFETL